MPFQNGIATMWCYVTEDQARAEAMLADVLAPLLTNTSGRSRSAQYFPSVQAEECAEKLLAYERAGAQRIFLWPLADERAQLEAFRERVVPLLDRADVGCRPRSCLPAARRCKPRCPRGFRNVP